MKKFILAFTAIISIGMAAAFANYAMTQGAGTTFGSVIVGGFHYVQMFVCDLTTPAQCQSVSAGGAASVNVTNAPTLETGRVPSNIISGQAGIAGGSGSSGASTTRVIAATDQGTNITATDCSGTITTGATAQNAFTAQTLLHGFTIANIDSSAGSGEPLWISFTTTAAASTAASYPLSAPTVTTFAGLSSFSTPPGFGLNHALSVIAATTGHKFSCTWW